jgi:hypothetical protein
MISAFDRILVAVPDLDAAVADYEVLLGPCQHVSGVARLPLQNVCIELRPSERGPAHIQGLSLLDDELSGPVLAPLDGNNRGLQLFRSGLRVAQPPPLPTATGVHAVDHLVLKTVDADDCIRLFGEPGLGLRLALDREVPEWGGRMLFFRHGKMTLEVIQFIEDPPDRDHFWGITYHCSDIEASLAALDARGVAHSPIREGRKPGTRVATVKSHCLGLPTLLIGR